GPRLDGAIGNRTHGLAPDSIIIVLGTVAARKKSGPLVGIVFPADNPDVVGVDLRAHGAAVSPMDGGCLEVLVVTQLARGKWKSVSVSGDGALVSFERDGDCCRFGKVLALYFHFHLRRSRSGEEDRIVYEVVDVRIGVQVYASI